MYISFLQDHLVILSIADNKAVKISEMPIGTSLIDFYNYYTKQRQIPKGQLLKIQGNNSSPKETLQIIKNFPLTSKFYNLAVEEEIIQAQEGYIDESKVESRALTYVCNHIQNAYIDLHMSLSSFPSAERNEIDRFNQTTFLFTHYEETVNGAAVFVPNHFSVSFTVMEEKVLQVYAVKTLYDFIALDFYYTFFSNEAIKKVGLCPNCGIAFRLGQKNKIYCSQKCKDEAIKAHNRKSPYYRKYRYLLQYYNRQLNSLRTQKSDSDSAVKQLQSAYSVWREWARNECEIATKEYEKQQSSKLQQIIMGYESENKKDVESANAFGERLKTKWKQLVRDIR